MFVLKVESSGFGQSQNAFSSPAPLISAPHNKLYFQGICPPPPPQDTGSGSHELYTRYIHIYNQCGIFIRPLGKFFYTAYQYIYTLLQSFCIFKTGLEYL